MVLLALSSLVTDFCWMAGKDRIPDMGSSSDTEDYNDLGADMRRARSYRRQRHYPSSPKPMAHSTPFGGARAKDGSQGAGSWSLGHQHPGQGNVPTPGQKDKITLIVDETR